LQPTKSDFERTPLLVRKNYIRAALDWLKINHCDYYNLEISQKNLDGYADGLAWSVQISKNLFGVN
jgi:hypothetical protein